MPVDDVSLSRRVQDLEARLADLQRGLTAPRQLSYAGAAPRERWLGRTTSVSASSYPTSGDTFEVELVSAYFSAAAGTQAITERLRGRKVVARTRPATYLPRNTEVEVWRSRGHGPLGVGEWWITVSPAESSNRLALGENNYGTDASGVFTHDVIPGTYYDSWGGALRINPTLLSERPTVALAADMMFGVPPVLPAAGQPTLRVQRAGSYLLEWSMQWSLPAISIGDHKALYYSGTSLRRLDGFGESGGPPPWLTGLDSPSTGTPHLHRHEHYIPLAEQCTVRVAVANPGQSHEPCYGSLPLSAYASGATGTRYGTVHGRHLLDVAVDDAITIDVSAATSVDLAYLWPPSRYPAMMRHFALTLLRIT